MITRRESTRSRRSSGFTLVELLVVFAIIAILAALTATAVFKVIGVQRANNTQLTIKSASSLLDKQWAAVVNQAKNEVIPASVMGMADNDPVRARVIWTKLRLRQEFPMTFSEALFPSITGAGTVVNVSDLPGKKYYYDRITQAFPQLIPILTPPIPPNPPTVPRWPNLSPLYPNASAIGQNSPPFTNSSQKLWIWENAFCLTMALQVNRGSIVFNEEDFAVNALSTDIFMPQSPGGRTLLFSGPKTLVDGWGFPLFFYRWPVGNLDFYPSGFVSSAGSTTASTSSLSQAARNRPYPDPLDPQGTLMDARWNKPTNTNVQWFEQYCHLVHSPWLTTYTPFTPYTEPVIVSAGPDNMLGITPSNTSPFTSDDMRLDPLATTAPQTFDNIASYKLRAGGTGDK